MDTRTDEENVTFTDTGLSIRTCVGMGNTHSLRREREEEKERGIKLTAITTHLMIFLILFFTL